MSENAVRRALCAFLAGVALFAACGEEDDPTGPGGGGSGLFLSAGDFGLPMVSSDGVNWTLASAIEPAPAKAPERVTG